MIRSHKRIIYKAFPVIGYEISKKTKLFDPKHPLIKNGIVLSCQYYPKYLMVDQIDYTKLLVNDFLTDEMVMKNYIEYDEVINHADMKNKLDQMMDMCSDKRDQNKKGQLDRISAFKNLINPLLRPHRDKRVYSNKKNIEVYEKFNQILSNAKQRLIDHQRPIMEDLPGQKEITLYEMFPNKIKINPSPYIVTIVTDINPTFTMDNSKNNFISGIYPVQQSTRPRE